MSHVTVTLALYVLICLIVSLHYYYEYTFVQPTVGICNSTSVSPTNASTDNSNSTSNIVPRELKQKLKYNRSKGYVCLLYFVGVGLNVSAFSASNTSIGLQWSDDTPGITNFKVCSYVCTSILQLQAATYALIET